MQVSGIKNINECEFVLPIEKGIYCLSGTNGCGKSTILSCLAQTVFSTSLKNMSKFDYNKNSSVSFEYNGKLTKWSIINDAWNNNNKKYNENIHFNGMYEGSLFYGTRFDDSLKIDELVSKNMILNTDIVDADNYVKDKLSFILHGNYEHYRKLKRVRNKYISQKVGLQNTPYFQEIGGNLISQYKMSSGECLLISLLHFIYNALIRRSLPTDKPILMLVDEIELALHPVAVSRLIDLLNDIIKEHNMLTVVLTSHSPEVIRKISPNNLYMMETESENKIKFYSPCYPGYAIRDVYMHSGFDFVVLVEDMLAKYVVEKVLIKENLRINKLINVLPIGGWENVLKFQQMAFNTNTFGIGSHVFSVLDGDIKNEPKLKKDYKKLDKIFLPVSSIEKYIHEVCRNDSYKTEKKKINDTFFSVESLDEILANYINEGDNNGKGLYRKILSNLEKRGISEENFVKELCEIIMQFRNFNSFSKELKSRIS